MGPLMVMRMARDALSHFKRLPPDEQVRLRGEADRVRQLLAEIKGLVDPRKPSSDAAMAEASAEREVRVVASELTAAVTTLSVAAGAGAAEITRRNSRMARMGGRVVSAGARRAKRKLDS